MLSTSLYLFFSALAVTGIDGAAVSKRLLNGVGLTPAMGWNNYNSGLQPDATNALNTANAFASLGLKQLGYTYVNMDDGWPTMSRNSAGNLVPNPLLFPNGILNVTTEIHSLGLKFGLYGDRGTQTCSGFPGSEGFEVQDAAQLAAWGVDYWKYDNCNAPSGDSEPYYQTMGNALAAQSHKILYSLCQWGQDSVWTWGATVGNSWRVGGDITNNWNSVASIAAANAPLAQYAQPGGFNDFDMMEIGNGVLTAAEERSHFSLWAISKSPLLLGTDLTKISASSLATIKNQAIIAINQDVLGIAAAAFQPSSTVAAPVSGQLYPYWSGKINGGYVIALIAVNSAETLSVSFAQVPGLGAGTFSWTELWTGVSGTGTGVSANLAEHDIAVFKVVSGTGGTGVSSTSTAVVSTKTSSTTTSASATSTATGTVPHYGQCGGIGWAGSTVCAAPYTCQVGNPYYSQCL